jgi:putative two-component system response regulator
MPVYNGVEFLTEMLRFEKYASVPIVVVTADPDTATRMEALNAGVIDFLNKPINFAEFKARVQNIAALAEARRQHSNHLATLRAINRPVSEADNGGGAWEESGVVELREREREILHRLTLATSYKDRAAARHGLRVAAFAAEIARAMGISENRCDDIRMTAPLFDKQTALACDTALLKGGKLTEADYRKLSKRANAASGPDTMPASLLLLADEIAVSYRERWDGRGYPSRLKGDAIPFAGRIVALAAGFEALVTERPFKVAWSFEQAVEHIMCKAGSHFDPACVKAFEAVLPRIRALDAKESAPIGYAAAS